MILASRVAVAPLSTTVTVSPGFSASNALIKSIIALFDGGKPKKFDATARLIFGAGQCRRHQKSCCRDAQQPLLQARLKTPIGGGPLNRLSASPHSRPGSGKVHRMPERKKISLSQAFLMIKGCSEAHRVSRGPVRFCTRRGRRGGGRGLTVAFQSGHKLVGLDKNVS
jgi:hypothetical protein